MREIEVAGGLPFTAIVNNSNVGADTTAEDVLSTVDTVKRLSEISGLPVIMTTVSDDVFAELNGRLDNTFSLSLQKKLF